jgi:hypothetical protein
VPSCRVRSWLEAGVESGSWPTAASSARISLRFLSVIAKDTYEKQTTAIPHFASCRAENEITKWENHHSTHRVSHIRTTCIHLKTFAISRLGFGTIPVRLPLHMFNSSTIPDMNTAGYRSKDIRCGSTQRIWEGQSTPN